MTTAERTVMVPTIQRDTNAGRKQWITPELREKRAQAAAVYANATSLEELHDTGKITARPHGERVMIRAILKDDGSELALDTYDARQSVAHEVVAVGFGCDHYYDHHGIPDEARDDRPLFRRFWTWLSGRGVKHGARVRAGDHCFVLSAACDRMSKTDKSVRLWHVHIEDVSSSWEVPKT